MNDRHQWRGWPARRAGPAAVPRAGFTLVELLVVIAIIGVLVGLLVPAVQVARASADRSTCLNQMKQIGLGVHSYSSTNQMGDSSYFPAASWTIDVRPSGGGGNGLGSWSWMACILPYAEQIEYYDALGAYGSAGGAQPFSSAAMTFVNGDNSLAPNGNYVCYAARGWIVPWSLCPSLVRNGGNFSSTTYRGNIGQFLTGNFDLQANNALYNDGAVLWWAKANRGQGLNFAAVTDGLSKTIFAWERNDATANSRTGKGWPQIFEFGGIPYQSNSVPLFRGSSCSAGYNTSGIGSAMPSSDTDQSKYLGANPASDHPGGGASVLMADGATQFLAKETDPTVFKNMASRNDGK